jgi:hypothetical protein
MSITTFDYVPKIILGKTGNYVFNSINLFTRAIAFYIYFKTTDELDILELILAYVFPIIYILYKISQENTDYIGGLFSFGSSSGERCIERRGADLLDKKHGDRKSIPEDAKACGDVVLDTINTASECTSIRSVGDPTDPDMYPEGLGACLYVPEEVDENVKSYKSYECDVYNSRSRCNSQTDDDNSRLCKWIDIDVDGTCSRDLYQLGIEVDNARALTRRECPISCEYNREAVTLTLQSDVAPASEPHTGTIGVAENVSRLIEGDALDFTAKRGGSGTCAISPTSFTVSSVDVGSKEITVNEAIAVADLSANCDITHTPIAACTALDSSDAARGGTRGGYCRDN